MVYVSCAIVPIIIIHALTKHYVAMVISHSLSCYPGEPQGEENLAGESLYNIIQYVKRQITHNLRGIEWLQCSEAPRTYTCTAITVWLRAKVTLAVKARDNLPDSSLATDDSHLPRL